MCLANLTAVSSGILKMWTSRSWPTVTARSRISESMAMMLSSWPHLSGWHCTQHFIRLASTSTSSSIMFQFISCAEQYKHPSKRQIWSRSILVMASYGRYGQCAARIGPDSMCWIWLPASDSVPFFSNKALIILYKTDLDLIWMALSGFGKIHLVWKQAGVQESLGPVSGRIQPAGYQLSTFRLGCNHPQTS